MKVCGSPGCVELTKTAYCEAHTKHRPHGWASSTRKAPRMWRKTRERILRRDGLMCVVCGNNATVVDHLLPMRWGGREEGNLRSMCHSCHTRKTNDEKQLGKALNRASEKERAEAIRLFLARWSAR